MPEKLVFIAVHTEKKYFWGYRVIPFLDEMEQSQSSTLTSVPKCNRLWATKLIGRTDHKTAEPTNAIYHLQVLFGSLLLPHHGLVVALVAFLKFWSSQSRALSAPWQHCPFWSLISVTHQLLESRRCPCLRLVFLVSLFDTDVNVWSGRFSHTRWSYWCPPMHVGSFPSFRRISMFYDRSWTRARKFKL